MPTLTYCLFTADHLIQMMPTLTNCKHKPSSSSLHTYAPCTRETLDGWVSVQGPSCKMKQASAGVLSRGIRSFPAQPACRSEQLRAQLPSYSEERSKALIVFLALLSPGEKVYFKHASRLCLPSGSSSGSVAELNALSTHPCHTKSEEILALMHCVQPGRRFLSDNSLDCP